MTTLDFQLSNTFEKYKSHMKANEKQTMFKEMGLKTLNIGRSLVDSQRANVIQSPENVLREIFINHEIKLIVETS